MKSRLKYFEEVSINIDEVAEITKLKTNHSGVDFGYVDINCDDFPHIRRVASLIKDVLLSCDYGVLLKIIPEFSNIQFRKLIWILASHVGDPIIQDSSGSKIMYVFDRDRSNSIFSGARYHQTHQGGSLHTDQGGFVQYNQKNGPMPIDYLVLGCINNGLAGGETILVHADDLHNELIKLPLAIDVLKSEFLWELRGQTNDLYQAPILSIGIDSKPRFRYIRPYMEATYNHLEKKLTNLQNWALDVLDSLLEDSKLQNRITLTRGEVLFFRNDRFIHGRTSFVDKWDGNSDNSINNVDLIFNKRLFQRIWLSETKSPTK